MYGRGNFLHRHKIGTWFVFILLTLIGCSKYDSQLEQALVLSKDNRVELTKVLDFYEKDSLKLVAIKFLIRNMPGHYSYAGNEIEQYYDALDTVLGSFVCSAEVMLDTLERVSAGFPSKYKMVSDVEVMTSDFLIANIEIAFEQWESEEWATHISFSDFCEYMLPYKSSEMQPIDNWRDYLKGIYSNGLQALKYCRPYEHSAIWAARKVNGNLKDSLQTNILLNKLHPIHCLSTKLKMPFGVCSDYVEIATSVLRSEGIPVTVDFTPQWPFRKQGHSWNVVLANNGRNIPFGGAETSPGEPHKLDEKMAKVYRRTYAADPDMQELLLKENNVPRTLNNLFMKDVTSEYMVTSDVEIKIDKQIGEYVYLAVFDNKTWVPVTFGKRKGSKVVFKNIGRNIVYMPVCCSEIGIQPIGNPFLLTSKGGVETIVPENDSLQSLILYRKYPLFPHVQEVAPRIVGAKFQASNSITFEDAVTVHEVKKWGIRGEEVNLPVSNKKYRYWRFYQPADGAYCNIADISFIARATDHEIRGEIIGTEGSNGGNPATRRHVAFDGDLLSYFDAPFPAGGWTGMDFGHPVDIGKIIYTPRGDGNTICVGDKYELFYWSFHRWNSLGKQIATTVKLKYDNVPLNGLYLLRNLTEGEEERVFTYVNGEQVFW